MKKLSIFASLFMGLAILASCETDRDDNPVIELSGSTTLGELVMNEPTFGNAPLDLEQTQAITLQARQQPTVGGQSFPLSTTYGAQMSLNGNWTDSASVYTIDVLSPSSTLTMSGSDINRGIMELGGYSDASQLDTSRPMDVLIRMTAKPTYMDDIYTAYSNAYTIKVYPYYQVLSAAEPDYWFLTGGCIGDGSWAYAKSFDAYKAVFPLSLVPEGVYDPKTGKGEFENTIYVPEDGIFKLRHYVDDWNEQWGWDGSAAVQNDGGSGNFAPTDGAGYYTIHYNSQKEEVTFTKSDKQDYTTYTAVSIIGVGGDWDNDIDMTPAAGTGENNHLWTAQLTIEETTVFKLRANHDWSTNWGYGAFEGEVNLYGFGEGNGQNIGIEPGKWTIYFDDISGFFRVVSDTEKQKPGN